MSFLFGWWRRPKPIPVPPTPTPSPADGETMEDTYLRLINKVRAERGLPLLKLDSLLNQAALAWSTEMGKNIRHLSHAYFSERISKYYPNTFAAENVAIAFNTEKAVAMWLDSPGHLKNILGNYDICGIAVYNDYWTANFVKL